ncbi:MULTISPECIES: ATP-binding cassette domain-containing protein [unclassified Acinetobacter]|uniref:ATP-binding cassette domain-containing protein n=1 Tax=unclassified Acinetobacter TaxID=196816 RepID=UPI002935267F|nr:MULTISPECIES: ATP-binding cassette domain-containing protein [unclassified Acinetobacter]WOE32010.1 ATP-binding cassette domain-containing protein [Acinetobacter sp. SAAs470]WOE37478.1 ATP-binding cassette domain-containing protein [Acinetobacter sp. SAAs474]
MTQTACIVTNLTVEFGNKTMFKALNFSLYANQITALIGRNGQGKSLLMHILNQASTLNTPYTGQICWQMTHAYLAQLQRLNASTIAEALGVFDLYQAFHRVELGIASFEDYEKLEHQWHLPHQWSIQLNAAQLPTDLDFPVQALSEGEKTKLALCALFLKPNHYLLLDEPSNHLDSAARDWLISQLKSHPAGACIISHDRTLLQHAEHIYYLNQHGLQHSTGNYEIFSEQYQKNTIALEKNIQHKEKEIKQIKLQQQQMQHKAQKREKQGEKIRHNHAQAKVILDFKKERASQSIAATQAQQQRQMQIERNDLNTHQQLLETIKPQQFQFLDGQFQSGEVLRVNNLKLPYGSTQCINFALHAGEKIHVSGRNGIGKSTLLKQITQPNPNIYIARPYFYLDQNFSFLQNDLTVLENLNRINPEITPTQWRNLLGQLRIRGDQSTYALSCLSGGEKLKVALLGLSHLSPHPEILLLDEPENHLDIESREMLAQAIRSYRGCVILISHDPHFVEACGIKDVLRMN